MWQILKREVRERLEHVIRNNKKMAIETIFEREPESKIHVGMLKPR
jgi:hypothetical protein